MSAIKQANQGQFYHKAQIEFGGDLQRRPCLIWDITKLGARISAESIADVPDTFDVLLAERGNVRRACQVQWRFDNQLGVHFVMKENIHNQPMGIASSSIALID